MELLKGVTVVAPEIPQSKAPWVRLFLLLNDPLGSGSAIAYFSRG